MTREAMQAALDAMEIKQRVTLWETSDDQRRYVLALRGLRAALAAEPSVTALHRFKSAAADTEPDPIERLRFFCSLAMTPRDWLDVEPFLDALTKDKL